MPRGLLFVCIFLGAAASFLGVAANSAGETRPAIVGRVVDEGGKPLAHASVLVFHAGVKKGYSTFCPSCYADCRKRVLTSADGAFEIKDLSPDLWFELLAVRNGYIAQFAEHVDPEKNRRVTISLEPRPKLSDFSGMVKGRVLDSAGSTVRDAVIESKGLILGEGSTYGLIPGLEPVAVTNSRGEFEIAYAKPTPKMLLSIEARAMAPKFVIMNTGSKRQTVVLSDGAAITGRLVSNGKPMGNVEVGLIAKEPGGFGQDLEVLGNPYEEFRVGTKDDGTFTITNVPQPVDWLVYAKMSSMQHGATEPVEVKTTRDNEYVRAPDLVVGAGFRLKGIVHLSDDRTIPQGTRITISSESAWDSQTAILAPDGTFEFNNLPAGTFNLTPSVKGYGPKSETKGNGGISIMIDRNVEDIHLTLYPRSLALSAK